MNRRILMVVVEQLRERALRSILTVFGIAIGIGALVSLILLSTALQESVTGQLDAFGANEILIAPLESLASGAPTGTGELTEDDLEVVESIPGVVRTIPMVATTLRGSYGDEERFLMVRGVPPEETEEFLGVDLLAGRYLQEGDRSAVLLGYRVAQDAFEREIIIGSRIGIGNDTYRVAGILVETGSLAEDQLIIVPIESLRDTIGEPGAVSAARAIIAPGIDMEAIEDRISRELERYRGEDDIGTTTAAQIQDQIGGFLGVLNVVVYSIAGISLIVAGMGVMNSLFTSVLERTREIGTMKAVGATNGQILSIFLIESALLGLAGGIIGVLGGALVAFGFIAAFNTAGIVQLSFALSGPLIIGSLLFSTVIGILAGVLPAMRAARLSPVDALRYE